MRKNRIRLALEAISVQNEELFKELTALYETLLETGRNGKVTIKDLDPVGEIIGRHTYVNIEMIGSAENSYDAYTCTPDMDANNPLAKGLYRMFRVSEDGLKKIAKTREALNAWVDLKTATVGGVLREIKVPLCIGRGWFNAKQIMEAPELASITLHELGHVFTDFEMLTEACSMNAIMQALAQDWLMSDRTKRAKLVDAAAAESKMQVDVKIRDALVTQEDPDKVITVMLSGDSFTPRSVFGISALDNVNCEAMADQFAARMGAGDYLAKALSKFYKYADIFTLKTRKAALISNIYILITAAGSGMVLLAPVAGVALLSAISFLACIETIISASDVDFKDVYDTPRNRLRRLLVEARGTLKRTDLNPAYVKRIIENLAELEKSIDYYSNGDRFFEGLVNTVWRSRGQAVTMRRRQEILESLGNNMLYQAAAQLRTNKE